MKLFPKQEQNQNEKEKMTPLSPTGISQLLLRFKLKKKEEEKKRLFSCVLPN